MWNRFQLIMFPHFLILLSFPWVVIILLGVVERRFGIWANTLGGLLVLVGFLLYLRWLWHFSDRQEQRQRDRIRLQYTSIYRVIGAPTDRSYFNWSKDSEVRVGDYGWEAFPPRRNGLIYLEGLTADWGVLWFAGFQPSQIELVCLKPVSQYDWRDFEYAGPKPVAYYDVTANYRPMTPCPFPVTAPEGLPLRFPHPF